MSWENELPGNRVQTECAGSLLLVIYYNLLSNYGVPPTLSFYASDKFVENRRSVYSKNASSNK